MLTQIKGDTMTQNYLWTDNPTEANVAVYDSDILNECLMHLKYQNIRNTRFCVNSASTDTSGVPNLLSYQGNTIKFNCGNSIISNMTSNIQDGWTLSANYPINTGINDIYKSFDGNNSTYCSIQHIPSESEPVSLSISKTAAFSFDYLYLYFSETLTPGTMKNFYILDGNENVIYTYENYEGILKQNTFLIPLQGFTGTKITISTKANINNTNYVNFPNTIKLLKKEQVLSFTNSQNVNYLFGSMADLPVTQVSQSGVETQNIYIKNDGQTEALAKPLTYGNVLPSNPVVNQVHYLTSAEPAQAKIYNGTTWTDCTKTPIGTVTFNNGNVTSVITNPYNQNGYSINSNTIAAKSGNVVTKDQFTQLLATTGWTKLPNGLILQWGTTGSVATVFPIAFPNAAFWASFIIQTTYTGAFGPAQLYVSSLSATGFTRSYYDYPVNWVAIGY